MKTSSTVAPVNQVSAPDPDTAIEPAPEASAPASTSAPRVVVSCPKCKATLSVRRVYIGNPVKCKPCGQIFTVPADAQSAPTQEVGPGSSGLPGLAPRGDVDPKNPRAAALDKPLLNQLAQFVAGNNELRAAHERLQVEHSELRADRDAIAARLDDVSAELAAIRADLGTIAPKDVQPLAAERAELAQAVQDLRREKQRLTVQQSKHEEMLDLLERKVTELLPFQAEHAVLSENLKAREGDIGRVRAERDAFEKNLSEHANDLETARSELADWARRMEQAEADLKSVSGHRDDLGEQLKKIERDLEMVQADLKHAAAERQSALDRLDQLSKTLAERDEQVAAERAHRHRLQDDIATLRADAEHIARAAEQLITADLNPPEAALVPASELEAARVQAKELKFKLDEAEYLYRMVENTLTGIGIQVSVPNRARPNAPP